MSLLLSATLPLHLRAAPLFQSIRVVSSRLVVTVFLVPDILFICFAILLLFSLELSLSRLVSVTPAKHCLSTPKLPE